MWGWEMTRSLRDVSSVALGILLAVVLTGCQQSPRGETDVGERATASTVTEPAVTVTEAVPAATDATVSDDGSRPPDPLDVEAAVRPDALAEDLGLELDGAAEMALRWTDDNGANVAVLSRRDAAFQNGTIELFADHYVLSNAGAPSRLRHVEDGVIECDFDEFADFFYGSFRVTDADSDGLGEVTFAYHFTCASGVDPVALKVLVLEDGEKYIVRGQSWSSQQFADTVGGDKLPEGTPEPPAEQWPPALWEQTSDLYTEAAIR
jgi:hypothetical protein